MTPLDITELCFLQAFLIRYRHELENYQDDEVFIHGKENGELRKKINLVSEVLDLVIDDIHFRVEQ